MRTLSERFTFLAAALGILVVGLAAGPAYAEGASSTANRIPCECRYGGQSYGQGECVCIKTSAGPRRACCGKVLNNSSWSFGDACPVAENSAGQTTIATAPGPSTSYALQEQPAAGRD